MIVAWTVIGNRAYVNHHSGNKPPECLPISAQYSESSNDWGNKLGVACCNDSGTGSRPDCLSAVTFDEANAKCQSKGLRLCTRNEIEEGKAEGTGCSFDAYLQWTSTPCGYTPPEPETRVCCRAMTADCLACADGITIDEYCKKKSRNSRMSSIDSILDHYW